MAEYERSATVARQPERLLGSAPCGADLCVVLHVPKTAGQSLLQTFDRSYEGRGLLRLYPGRIVVPTRGKRTISDAWDTARVDRYVIEHGSGETRCLFGHLAYLGVHAVLGAETSASYVTFLREPVQRFVSSYHYLKTRSKSSVGEAIAREGWSLDTFSAIPHTRNLQLRHLILGSPVADPAEPEMTREHLEEGKRRLRQFWFVGLTETFDEDAHYLYGKLGFQRFGAEWVNATPGKEMVSPALWQAIAERNALDIELYEYARDLRREFVDANALDIDHHRRKALMARGGPDADRSSDGQGGAAINPSG